MEVSKRKPLAGLYIWEREGVSKYVQTSRNHVTMITRATIKMFAKYLCMIAIVFQQCSANNTKISSIISVPFLALVL